MRSHNSVPVNPLRSVGNGYIVFTVESFIDELASLAGIDPVSYRLEMLDGSNDKIESLDPNSISKK